MLLRVPSKYEWHSPEFRAARGRNKVNVLRSAPSLPGGWKLPEDMSVPRSLQGISPNLRNLPLEGERDLKTTYPKWHLEVERQERKAGQGLR